MKTLAEMLMQDVALSVWRPGSWEGANMPTFSHRMGTTPN
jgi:hypothetical protein